MQILLILVAGISQSAFSHKEWVHQYQVKQAYLLLKNQLGGDIPQMSQFVGMDVSGPGNASWRTRSIVAGAWREDIDDVVWHVGECNGCVPPPCGFIASSTHFWDADAGDNSTFDVPGDWSWCGGIGNAYQKALRLLWPSTYGQWRVEYRTEQRQWLIDKVGGGTVTINTVALGLTYNSLVEFYTTGNIWVVGYVNIETGQWVTAASDPLLPFLASFGQYYRDEIVWEALGRVAHLIGDMSVPAHAKNDIHPCYAAVWPLLIEEGDSYELWCGGSPAVGHDRNTQQSVYPAQNKTWLDALGQGGYINVFGKENPIRYLMYTTNQLSDHFGSLAVVAPQIDDRMWRPGDNDYQPVFGSDQYTELVQLMNTIGAPVTEASQYAATKEQCLSTSFAYSIRAIAGLLHWFAAETNLIPQIIVKNAFAAGNVKVDGVTYPSGTSFSWTSGSTHTIEAIDRQYVQESANGKWYYRIYQNWQKNSDPPSGTNPRTITVDGSATYTANFLKQFDITFQNNFIGVGNAGVMNINNT